jgi:hypothetical protein
MLCGRLAKGRQNEASYRPPWDDDNGYTGHVVTWLYEPGGNGDTGAVLPMLGELVVMVNWVSGWEEDHVIAVTEGHEL